MTLLADKIALITGAAAGIGRAAALTFAREGAALVLGDLDEDGLAETARLVEQAGGRAAYAVADVSRRDDVQALVDRAASTYGRLDCAFNNAGITGPLRPLVGYPDEDFDRVMDVNVRGIWLCVQAEIPLMLAGGGGSIVNASSGLGAVAAPQMSGYVASKHAVLGITRAAALEYALAGIRVNAVLPGIVDTTMPVKLTASAPEVMEILRSSSPMGRLARPEEIAEAAAWLCSDRASFVNGHGLAVDGGILSQ